MCILVVEDDVLIRMILVEELESAGYTVKEAGSGDQAIEIFDTAPKKPSCLITDIHMPGRRSGIDAVAYIREKSPAMPVIFTTGCADAMIAGQLLPGDRLVRKPYVPADILKHLGGDQA